MLKIEKAEHVKDRKRNMLKIEKG